MYFQYARALVTLYRLSVLEDPAWDRNMVRNTANILEILDQLSYCMKTCADSLNVRQEEWNIFERGAKMNQSIKQGWEPKLMEIWYPNVPANDMGGDFVTPNSTLEPLPIDGLDDMWMMEIFGSMG